MKKDIKGILMYERDSLLLQEKDNYLPYNFFKQLMKNILYYNKNNNTKTTKFARWKLIIKYKYKLMQYNK